MSGFSLRPESPRQPEVLALIDELDAYQKPLYPPESFHGVDLEALCAPEMHFLVLRDAAGQAQGCGAVWACTVDGAPAGEIKRVFVRPALRGQGAAKALMQALEAQARGKGAQALWLETGCLQHEAIGLYERLGFHRCAAFGDYAPDPLSVFMRKDLLA